MAKIFAGLTGRCQHPSLNTNYIISTLKAAMENWRIQIQVPGGMLCLVSAINPFTEAMLLPSSHLQARIYCLANPSQQRLESRQSGICTESIHLQLAGPQDQMWASRKLESSAANPKWVAQPPPNWRKSVLDALPKLNLFLFPLNSLKDKTNRARQKVKAAFMIQPQKGFGGMAVCHWCCWGS